MSTTAYPPRDRPLLAYDGDCSFCRRWAGRCRTLCGERVEYEPFQTAAARFPDVPYERFRHSVHLIFPDGRICTGAEAAFSLLALSPRWAWMLWMYRRVPGFARVAEWGYRFVSEHRPMFDRIDRWMFGHESGQSAELP